MSTAVSLSPKFQERRDFERVQDAVALELLLPGEPSASTNGIRDKYSLAGYEAVRADYPEITSYISELESHLRDLAPAASEASDMPTHKVSLSGSGMAFADERMLQPGDIVDMRITLFPSRVSISCSATVISVGDATEVDSGEKHTYRCVFNQISEDDRITIDQHVHALRGLLPVDSE